MHRFLDVPALSLLGALALAACEQPPATAPAADAAAPDATVRASHAPGAPTAIPFSVTFPDDDPCTEPFDPTEHIVTISGTLFVHSLPNGKVVIRAERTITTDSEYEGRGEHTFVDNGNVIEFQLNDINTHPDGRKFRAHVIVVVDLSAGTVRVAMGGLECIKT